MAERGTRWSGALVLAGVDEGPRSGVRAEFGGVSGADGRGDDPRRRWGGHKGVLKAGFNRRSQRIGHLGMRIGLSDRAALVQRQGTDMQQLVGMAQERRRAHAGIGDVSGYGAVNKSAPRPGKPPNEALKANGCGTISDPQPGCGNRLPGDSTWRYRDELVP